MLYLRYRISLRLIGDCIQPTPSFVETFLRDRDRDTCPRSRDRSRERDRVESVRGKGRSAEPRGRAREGRKEGVVGGKRKVGRNAGGCPNGIRIGMGREPCTKQPRRHPAFARIATLHSVWLAHGKHTVPRERKQILRNRAVHCLGIHRVAGSTSNFKRRRL